MVWFVCIWFCCIQSEVVPKFACHDLLENVLWIERWMIVLSILNNKFCFNGQVWSIFGGTVLTLCSESFLWLSIF
jgi:hypothetical protein